MSSLPAARFDDMRSKRKILFVMTINDCGLNRPVKQIFLDWIDLV